MSPVTIHVHVACTVDGSVPEIRVGGRGLVGEVEYALPVQPYGPPQEKVEPPSTERWFRADSGFVGGDE